MGRDTAQAGVYHQGMERRRTIYTPSELNREVRLHIEAGFPGVWIEGEISNLRRPASGHLYFSLKDDQAQIRCALFRSHAIRLGFKPEDGLQVQAHGRLSLFEPRGDYQLIADVLEESGEGRLRAAFEALKRKLEREGLFAAEAKRPPPPYPARIAVVTSPAGAVIRDILHVLERRWPLAAVRLYPVPVQGDEAPAAIVAALGAVNDHGWAEAVIVARGGGSLEDLQAFNDESVARAVFESAIPVVSAVGHETDFSICDFTADLRAPTPSAAAELLAPDQAMLKRSFEALGRQLARRMQARLLGLAQRHDHLAHRLSRQHPEFRLAQLRKSLNQYRSRLVASGRRLIPQRRATLGNFRERLFLQGQRIVPDRRRRLRELARTLHAVSPLPTLDRGYAVVTDRSGERIISSVEQVQVGAAIAAQMRDGRLYGKVEEVTGERLAGTGSGGPAGVEGNNGNRKP
jgi:exodeoxyribonuclease VII large subunit